jgi:hypothetical protein
MKLIAASAICAMLVAGCGAPPYVTMTDDLGNAALARSYTQARSVKDYLATGKTREQAIEAAKAAITASLKDPGSAMFRYVKLKKFGDGEVVCGEVNAKNSYGGYVGFKRFVAGITDAKIETAPSEYPNIDTAANRGFDMACM